MYTPTDEVNYERLTGSITPYRVSAGGGGGGFSAPEYSVAVSGKAENGAVRISTENASEGETVTIETVPNGGYTLEKIAVFDKNGREIKTDAQGGGRYTFLMPASEVTVAAVFAADDPAESGFSDVSADAYHAAAVRWAVNAGITDGVGGNRFAPDESCTRAQIVMLLYRAAGSVEPKTASGFADVPADVYYAKAVAWAVENGITGGVGNNRFAPELTCTRAQTVAFLFRCAAASGTDAVTLQELVGAYSDASQVSEYARAAFNWALAETVVQGSDGSLMPNGDCSRAQIVTMLYRMLGT